MLNRTGWKQKGQKLDEGVPRASDQRSRLEMLESASPVAFAKNPHFPTVHAEFQFPGPVGSVQPFWCNPRVYNLLRIIQTPKKGTATEQGDQLELSESIVGLTVRILEMVHAGHAFRSAL
jgi:hypothetical protein